VPELHWFTGQCSSGDPCDRELHYETSIVQFIRRISFELNSVTYI